MEVALDIDALADVFRRVVHHLDEPVAGPGVLPQQLVYDASASDGTRVVLTGHGGDELFGGYTRHRGLYFRQRLFDRCATMTERGSAAVELGRLALGLRRRLTTATTVADADLDPGFLDSVSPEVRAKARRGLTGFASAVESMQWDLENYLPGLLHAEDRVSMAASIESRSPLLDYRIVELALSTPEDRHFRRGTSKPILRDAVGPRLPPSVAARRDKKGFPTPLDDWERYPRMRRLVHELARAAGLDRRGGESTVFRSSFVSRPDAMSAGQLWTVMQIQAWFDHDDAVGEAP